MSGIGDLTARISMDSHGFKEGCEESEGALHGLGEAFQETAGILGVGLGVERFVEGIKGQIEAVTELSHASEKLDMPINSLQALQHEAAMNHVEFGAMESGLQKMLKNLGEAAGGSKETADAFKLIGVNVRDIIGLRADQQFEAIADGISHLENRTDRTDAAMKIFGRGGAELLNVLGEGSAGVHKAAEELEKMGLSISDVDAEKLKEADKAMVTLKESVAGLFREFAVNLAPAIKQATEALTEFLSTGKKGGAKPGGTDTGVMDVMRGIGQETFNTYRGAFGAAQMGLGAITGTESWKKSGREHLDKAMGGEKSLWNQLIWGRGGAPGLNPGDVPKPSDYPSMHDEKKHKSAASAMAEQAEKERLAKSAEKLKKEADQFEETFKTPLERARAQFHKAFELWEEGALSAKTVAAARDKMLDEEAKEYHAKNKINEEVRKKQMHEADELHEQGRTPEQKFQEQVEKLLYNPFLTDRDRQQGIKKAKEEYGKEKNQAAPHDMHQTAMTAGSKEFLSRFAETLRGDPAKDAAQRTAAASEQMVQSLIQIQKQMEAKNKQDPEPASVTGSSMSL